MLTSWLTCCHLFPQNDTLWLELFGNEYSATPVPLLVASQILGHELGIIFGETAGSGRGVGANSMEFEVGDGLWLPFEFLANRTQRAVNHLRFASVFLAEPPSSCRTFPQKEGFRLPLESSGFGQPSWNLVAKPPWDERKCAACHVVSR